MGHRIPYMYINFQQNQVSRSLKTVHTNIFANNRKLHKIATTNSNIEKMIISEMHHRITYVYINFQQIRVNIDQSKLCSQIYLQIIASCINLQLPIVILENRLLQTCVKV